MTFHQATSLTSSIFKDLQFLRLIRLFKSIFFSKTRIFNLRISIDKAKFYFLKCFINPSNVVEFLAKNLVVSLELKGWNFFATLCFCASLLRLKGQSGIADTWYFSYFGDVSIYRVQEICKFKNKIKTNLEYFLKTFLWLYALWVIVLTYLWNSKHSDIPIAGLLPSKFQFKINKQWGNLQDILKFLMKTFGVFVQLINKLFSWVIYEYRIMNIVEESLSIYEWNRQWNLVIRFSGEILKLLTQWII